MNLRMKRIGLVFLLCSVLFIHLLAFADRDYSTPGFDGTLPPDSPNHADHFQVYGGGPALPSPLPCSKLFKIHVGVKEDVDECKDYNFKPLYDKAKAITQERLSKLKCDKDCLPNPNILELRHSWHCSKDELTAYADVYTGIVCLKDKKDSDEGLDPPTEEMLHKNNYENNRDGVDVFEGGFNENITDGSSYHAEPPVCGKARFMKIVVRSEDFEDCESIKSYEPYVKRAEELVDTYAKSYPCPDKCPEKKVTRLKTTWECEKPQSPLFKHQAVAAVYFKVECAEKKPEKTGMSKPLKPKGEFVGFSKQAAALLGTMHQPAMIHTRQIPTEQPDDNSLGLPGFWEGWGNVTIDKLHGVYTDTYGGYPGWMVFFPAGPRKYHGRWGEARRTGTLELILNDKGTRADVTWKVDPSTKVGPINSGTSTWIRKGYR